MRRYNIIKLFKKNKLHKFKIYKVSLKYKLLFNKSLYEYLLASSLLDFLKAYSFNINLTKLNSQLFIEVSASSFRCVSIFLDMIKKSFKLDSYFFGFIYTSYNKFVILFKNVIHNIGNNALNYKKLLINVFKKMWNVHFAYKKSLISSLFFIKSLTSIFKLFNNIHTSSSF